MSPKKDSASGMKSAYELALERLESQGIERPRKDGLDAGIREGVAEIRRRTEAKLAELEILHRDRVSGLADPVERAESEQEYVRERRKLEESQDDGIERLRNGRPPEETPP
jgi:hypothetical protein